MTGFDDDPEYEAQLKQVLGEWPVNGNGTYHGEVVEGTDPKPDNEELPDDAPTFRFKLPLKGKITEEVAEREEDEDDDAIAEGIALSEDARSISTGDDSPSVHVLS